MTDKNESGCAEIVGGVIAVIAVGAFFFNKFISEQNVARCHEILSKPAPEAFDCKAWMASRKQRQIYEDGSTDADILDDLRTPNCAAAARNVEWAYTDALEARVACQKDPASGGRR